MDLVRGKEHRDGRLKLCLYISGTGALHSHPVRWGYGVDVLCVSLAWTGERIDDIT